MPRQCDVRNNVRVMHTIGPYFRFVISLHILIFIYVKSRNEPPPPPTLMVDRNILICLMDPQHH